jgi:hypothetical protein
MVKADRALRATTILIALAMVSTLSACAVEDNAISLADTKAPTQLLRNDAAGRVPDEAILAVGQKSDGSEGCALDNDPDGLMRKWHSSLALEINSSSAPQVGDISADLSKSYVDEGWDEFLSEGTDSSTRTLKKNGSRTQLIITTTADVDGDGLGATIAIDVLGQCVKTGGPNSDEVVQLGTR